MAPSFDSVPPVRQGLRSVAGVPLAAGRRVGVVDLTRGELSTRGAADLRDEEARATAQLLDLTMREYLRMRDGFFANDEAHQRHVVAVIRRFRPRLVLTNSNIDHHPDHGRTADLVHDAAFPTGLAKVETEWKSTPQAPWRPRLLLQALRHACVRPRGGGHHATLGAKASRPGGLQKPVLPPRLRLAGPHLHFHADLLARPRSPCPRTRLLHRGGVCRGLHLPPPLRPRRPAATALTMR